LIYHSSVAISSLWLGFQVYLRVHRPELDVLLLHQLHVKEKLWETIRRAKAALSIILVAQAALFIPIGHVHQLHLVDFVDFWFGVVQPSTLATATIRVQPVLNVYR
jgi:hypothetical protein